MALLELDAGGDRGVDRRLPRGHLGGVCLAAPDGDRRAARAGRCGDRGGGRARTGWRGASTWTWRPIIPSWIRCCPSCGGAGRFDTAAADDPGHHHHRPDADRAPVFDADYWAANLRNPVRFSQAVAAAGADHATFIEISPHPLLTHAITDTLGQRPSPQHRQPCSATPTTRSPSTPTSTPPTPPTRPTPSIRPSHIRSCPPPPGTTPSTGSPSRSGCTRQDLRPDPAPCSASTSRSPPHRPHTCGRRGWCRRPSRIRVAIESTAWKWFRYRFCYRPFRPQQPNVAHRHCLTSDSSIRSSSTSRR